MILFRSFCFLIVCITSFAFTVEARDYRVLAVRVDFPYEDPDHDTTSGRGKFDLRDYHDPDETDLRSEYDNPWDIPPHGRDYFDNHLTALNNYWRTVSEERVVISYDIWPESPDSAYTMSKKFYKYGNGRSKDETYRKLVELLEESLLACKRADGDNIDFTRYDTFMVIHAGIGSETSGVLNDIPSAYISGDDIESYLDGPLVIDGKIIDNGLIIPETTAGNGYGGLNGIMAQMFGHRLGLPSMSNNEDGLPAAGGWSLMDTGSMSYGHGTRGFVPTHPCAWSKIDLGWIEPLVVTADTTLDIAATHVSGKLPRVVKVPITTDEYLLIENRIRYASRDSMPEVVFSGPDDTGVWLSVDHYDAFIPGSGIIVWHINDAIIHENREDNTINDDHYRRGIDILEADGKEDIGAYFGFGEDRSEYSEGDDDDTYKSNRVSVIGPATEPNTGSMWGGRSGVTITVNSEPGDIMNVTIAFADQIDGFPVELTGAKSLSAVDFDGDGIDELIATDNESWSFVSSEGVVTKNDYPAGHPAAICSDNGGLALVSFDRFENTIYVQSNNGENGLYFFDVMGPAQVSFSGCPTAVRQSVNSDGLLIFAENSSSGEPLPSSLMFLSDINTAVSFLEIQLPDAASFKSLASTFSQMAFLSGENTLYLGSLSDETLKGYPLSSTVAYGPIMADFDRDDVYETAVVTDRAVLIFETDGTRDTAFLSGVPSGDPAVADINGDGYPDIIVCAGRNVWAFGRDGIPLNGFPHGIPPGDVSERFTSPPVIADLDGDGDLDIAAVTSDMRIIAFDALGSQADGFPVATKGAVDTSPCIFRYDDTGTIAIAYITTDGLIAAHDLGVSPDDNLLPWPMWQGGPGLSSATFNADISSGVQTTSAFEAYCYPNPITTGFGTFRVTPSDRTDLNITVYTADGVKVYEVGLSTSEVVPGEPNEVRMNVSDLASGLYIAKIATKQKTVYYKLGVLK